MDRPEMNARPGYDRGRPPRFTEPGVPGRQSAPDDDCQGDWVDRVDRLPALSEPPTEPEFEPEFEHYQDEFHGLLDRTRSRKPARRWVAPLLGALGAAALLAAAIVVFRDGESAPEAATPGPPSAAAPETRNPASPCPPERVGNQIQGNGEGGFDTGPAVIFAFQHAYYVARSGEQVRATTTLDASVESAEAIQTGIDSIPANTTYCVAITPGAFAGQYSVVVTEYRPGQGPTPYNPQIVTTIREGGRTLISAIGQG